MARITPSRWQPDLPMDSLILTESPGAEAVEMDVLFVGGGPAGLAGAIELARLVKEGNEKQGNEKGQGLGDVQIAVLEKAEAIGQHNLSGAVVNPRSFRELFPGMPDSEFPFRGRVDRERVYAMTPTRALRIPTPPPMRNHGNYVASLCEVVRWLGAKAEALGVNLLPGFPARSLLVEGTRVRGVRTTASGLGRDGRPGPGHSPPTDVTAKVTALSEGTRGLLTQGWMRWRGVSSDNPQVYELGVKEIWETKVPLDAVVHTVGWPVPPDAFGGSFLYPLEKNLVALGLVVGLDYGRTSIDVHALLQGLKRHPMLRRLLEGGACVEWGAKTIPGGGWHSLPKALSGDGCVVLGDAAGFVDVPSLKGIHYAMKSGIEAARAIHAALVAKDTSGARLSSYDRAMSASFVAEDLRSRRNVRIAFSRGLVAGTVLAGLTTLSGGRLPHGRVRLHEDAARSKRRSSARAPSGDRAFLLSKVDAVYRSGNVTRDDIPSHLIAKSDVPGVVAEMYQSLCPAGVYERRGDGLVINAPNCVDCKATDVLGPRWTPREGGSGPHYKRM